MEGWKDIVIENEFDLGRGRVINQKEIDDNNGIYPVYSSQSYNNGEMGKISTYDFEGELITWTTDGAYAGTVFHRQGKFNCTNVCGTLKAKDEEKINPLFVSYLLSTVAKKYVSYVGNPKLMNGVMAKIPLFIPISLTEQRKIAEILTTIDQNISQTEQLIDKYKKIKDGLLHDLLTFGIDENGKIRNPQTHSFVIKKGMLVPEEWEVDEINNIFDIVSGSTPSTSVAEFWDGNINWITPYDLNKIAHFYISESSRKITELGLQNCSAKKIPANSIVMSSRAPIGYLAIPLIEYTTNQGCKSLIIKNNERDLAEFYILILKFYINKIKNLGTGTTFTEISKTDLGTVFLPFPKIKEEQNKIAKIIFKQDQLIEAEQTNLHKLQELKQGLMQDLLTGKVRVKNT